MTGPTIIPPVPGDATSEQVATDAQSTVTGRVGPRTIAEDSTSPFNEPTPVTKVAPGQVEGT
jgi:hypothetical protein